MHWKELDVWKIAHQSVLDIYKATSSFPRSEALGVTDQLRRAAYSVPANIVEVSVKEYNQGILAISLQLTRIYRRGQIFLVALKRSGLPDARAL
jgi:hypothetical protein